MTRVPKWRVMQGGAIELLERLPSDSVDEIVTSPPYFGLRDS